MRATVRRAGTLHPDADPLGVTRPWPLKRRAAGSRALLAVGSAGYNGTTTRARDEAIPSVLGAGVRPWLQSGTRRMGLSLDPRASVVAPTDEGLPFGDHSWGQAKGKQRFRSLSTPTGSRCSPSLRSDDTLKRPYLVVELGVLLLSRVCVSYRR